MLLASHYRTWGARGTLFRVRLVATANARVQQQVVTPHLVPATFSSSSAYRERMLMSPTSKISMVSAAAIVTSSSDAAAAVSLDPISVANAASDATALVVAGLNAGFPTWYPHAWLSYGLMRGMGEVVSAYGVEWWVAIAGVSIALRPLTVPPALFAQRTSARFAYYKDEMAVFSTRITDANKREDKGAASQAIADYRVFMASKNLNIFSGMLLPIITQAFVFISMFSSLRWLISDAALIPGFLEGGKGLGLALLTVPDPTFVLPGVAAVMTAASVWFNPNISGMADRGLSAGGHRLAFTGLSTIVSAISCFFPAAIQLHIAISATTSLLQNTMLRQKWFSRALGFPESYPPKQASAEDARRSLAAVLSGEKILPPSMMDNSFQSLRSTFIRLSAIAEGDYKTKPRHVYLGITGLRDPGFPPPPSTGYPSAIGVIETAAKGIPSEIPVTLTTASTENVRTIITPSVKITSTEPPILPGTLLKNRPRSLKK